MQDMQKVIFIEYGQLKLNDYLFETPFPMDVSRYLKQMLTAVVCDSGFVNKSILEGDFLWDI